MKGRALLDGGGVNGTVNFGVAGCLGDGSIPTVLELIKFAMGTVFFFYIYFWGFLGIRVSWRHDFCAIYAFNFVAFVFLDRALSIMVITSAFIATRGEMASVR